MDGRQLPNSPVSSPADSIRQVIWSSMIYFIWETKGNCENLKWSP